MALIGGEVAEQEPFVWSDAWLLLAIIYAGREGGNVETLIEVGDFINHAIFIDEELEGGFRRLGQAGYIQEADGIYKACEVAWQAYDRNGKPRRYVYKAVEDMVHFLGV